MRRTETCFNYSIVGKVGRVSRRFILSSPSHLALRPADDMAHGNPAF